MALTPGERIELKKRISETLGQQDWGNIDLTLHEFGFPTLDDWREGPEPYVVQMLRDAADEDLAGLDAYLHPGDAPTAPPQPESFDDEFSIPGHD